MLGWQIFLRIPLCLYSTRATLARDLRLYDHSAPSAHRDPVANRARDAARQGRGAGITIFTGSIAHLAVCILIDRQASFRIR